jgi:phage terminase small subunit
VAEEVKKAITDKQKRFVREWLVDMNGTRAAIRAGYSEKSAAQTASRLMKDPAVREYRDALLKEEFDSLGITRHSLAVEVWRVYERCAAATPVLQWDSNMRDYIESGDWQFDSKGCLKALGMLNGMLERIERSEDEDAADGYETMLSGGGREF